MCTGFWWGNLKERPRHRGEDNFKIDLKEVGCGARTGLDWLRIWADGGLL